MPRVTAVIASYCWPEALAISLASALTQTVDDIEILVIEDGSDRRSRDVVEAAADSRVRWLCLDIPSGSQSGPNALGISEAHAPVVAYLGHDDIWHPRHLELLLQALGDDADLAHSTTLLLGDDGRIELAGGETWSTATFVPPSSVAHLRDSRRVGDWTAAEVDGWPVDHRFLLSGDARGMRVVKTGVVTVAKFPAAWRADSYVTRDVSPQRAFVAKLRSDPDSLERCSERALQHGATGVLPAPPAFPPGVIADHNRRMKGLPSRYGHTTRWTPTGVPLGGGWHMPERDAIGEFIWTAPPAATAIRLDAPKGDCDLMARIVLGHVVRADQLDDLEVELDTELAVLSVKASPPNAAVVEARVNRPARASVVEIVIRAPGICPAENNPASPDRRTLGVAVREMSLQ